MFEKEIAAGADVLDKNSPGWENLVNLETMDMRGRNCLGDPCLLDMVFGSYREGIIFLCDGKSNYDSISPFACSHGFSLQGWFGDQQFKVLTEEWKDFILNRLEEKGSNNV